METLLGIIISLLLVKGWMKFENWYDNR